MGGLGWVVARGGEMAGRVDEAALGLGHCEAQGVDLALLRLQVAHQAGQDGQSGSVRRSPVLGAHGV